MGQYTIQIEDGKTACEITGISVRDRASAREYAVRFVSSLFMSPEIVALRWDRCRVRVLAAGGDQVFAATAQDVALIERDELPFDNVSSCH